MMAFTGVLILCTNYAGSDDPPLIGPDFLWSQTFAVGSPGQTSRAAPDPPSGKVIFEIVSGSNDILICKGKAPDTANGPFLLIQAGAPAQDILANPGDKVAFVIAT